MKQHRVDALSKNEKDTAQAACRSQKLALLNNIESKYKRRGLEEQCWQLLGSFGGILGSSCAFYANVSAAVVST